MMYNDNGVVIFHRLANLFTLYDSCTLCLNKDLEAVLLNLN